MAAVDVCNELTPDRTQAKDDSTVTKNDGQQTIPENANTDGTNVTDLDTCNELNSDKFPTKQGETLDSIKINAKSDETPIQSSADQLGLSVTAPKNEQWRSTGNII